MPLSKTLIIPPDAIAVVPSTSARSQSLSNANSLMAVGILLIPAIQAAGPGLEHAYPQAVWLGPAIAAIGAAWLAYIRRTEQGQVAAANYSPPGVPSADTHPMAQAVADNPAPPAETKP